MFILFLNDSEAVIDTAQIEEDSVTIDTVAVYEVPEIISFGSQVTAMINSNLLTLHEIIPYAYNMNLSDAFFRTSSMLYLYGDGQFNSLSQNGLDPRQTNVFLNYHQLENPLFGYTNLSQFPIQFFETISAGTDIQHPSAHAINLITKINRYDKPYSSVSYTTGDFGTNIYNIDFTRPITNDLGFYLSGLYRQSQGYRDSSDWKMSSLSANVYYNHFIPMRCDILYSLSDYGIPGSTIDTLYARQRDRFTDASFVFGSAHHKAVLYLNQNTSEYSDPISSTPLATNITSYGISTIGFHELKNMQFLYGFNGTLSTIESDLYGSHKHNSLGLWTTAHYAYKTFIVSASGHGEVRNTDDFFFAPSVIIGLQVFKSTYIVGTVSRGYRAPSLSELDSTTTVSLYYRIIGNEDLRPEYYWKQQIGISRHNFTLQFYTIDFTDRIVVQPDADGYDKPVNIDSWHIFGAQTRLEVPLSFITQTARWELSAGLSGHYLFDGYSFPFMPRSISSLFISGKRETERFTLSIGAQGRFVDTRSEVNGQTVPSFTVFSAAGTVRFLALSLTLCIDNILNANYTYMPYYPMAPRNYNFSIKWEFWD